MLAKERHDQIIAKLNLEGNVRVKELSQSFGVTEDCIRKDLTILEKEGKLKRIHGGATKIRENLHYYHVDERKNIDTPEKKIIALKAVELIEPGSMVFLDISTISLDIAKLIYQKNLNITVVTNMIEIMMIFTQECDTKLIFIGGQLNEAKDGFIGSAVIDIIKKYKFDLSFLGVVGIDIYDGKVTTYDTNDGLTKKEIMNSSKESYMLVQSSKFDLDGNFIQKYSNATLAGMDIEDSCENVGSCISSVIDNPNKTAYGFYWSSTGTFDFNAVNYKNRMPVDQYDFDGNMLNAHKSASDACEFIGKTTESVSQILDVCRGKASQAHGYIWRFKDDPFDLYNIPIQLAKIKIDKYTTDGVFIATYDSFQDALRAMGKDIDQGCNLRKGCLGISPIVFGFVWRFYGEPFDKYPVYKNRGGSDKPVDQYTFDGIFVNTYPSAAEGGRTVGLTNGAQVTQVCKGNRYSAGGYLWRYHDVPLDSFTVTPKKASPKKGQPINVYDLDDNFLYTKESSKVIAKELNCSPDTIYQKCRGVSNHIFNNLKYYYSYDSEQPDTSKITEPIYPYLKE